MTTSFQPKYISSGAPFLSPSTKPNVLPSKYPLPDTSILTIKDSIYFLIDQPTSTPTSTIRRNTSKFPTVQSNLAPSHITSSVPIFETSHLMR